MDVPLVHLGDPSPALVWFPSTHQTRATSERHRHGSGRAVITPNQTRAGCRNKHNISVFGKIAWLYVKIGPLFSLAFQNKRINMSIFPTLVPFHAALLLLISRSASAYLSMRRRTEAGGHC